MYLWTLSKFFFNLSITIILVVIIIIIISHYHQFFSFLIQLAVFSLTILDLRFKKNEILTSFFVSFITRFISCFSTIDDIVWYWLVWSVSQSVIIIMSVRANKPIAKLFFDFFVFDFSRCVMCFSHFAWRKEKIARFYHFLIPIDSWIFFFILFWLSLAIAVDFRSDVSDFLFFLPGLINLTLDGITK